jgi:hypothetical protein
LTAAYTLPKKGALRRAEGEPHRNGKSARDNVVNNEVLD